MSYPGFGPYGSQLASIFQTGFLARQFQEPLINALAYRALSEKVNFDGRIGGSITLTRASLMAPNITPLDPSTNTNIDNGLIPGKWNAEQYTLSINQYPQVAPIVNILDDEAAIASIALKNTEACAIAQACAIDQIARNALFNAYMGGNTIVTTTLGSAGPTITVDDTRGFQTTYNSIGIQVPVTPTNPLPVIINGNYYAVQSFADDLVNISSAVVTGGTSGTITLTSNVIVADGTAGNSVLSGNALGQTSPLIIRPNGRKSTSEIQSGDIFNLQVIRDAVAYLRNNSVKPAIDGYYVCILDPTSESQLFQDPTFQILYRGATLSNPNWQHLRLYEVEGVLLVKSTEVFVQPQKLDVPVPVNQRIRRPIIVGEGALIEGIFTKGLNAIQNMSQYDGVSQNSNYLPMDDYMGEIFDTTGCYLTTRLPLDRLRQIISQTSNYVGGFVVPTDIFTNPSVIGTSSYAFYKRAVVIETQG